MSAQVQNGHANGNGNGNHYTTSDTFITSRGVKVRFIGLNPARLEKLQSAGKLPPVPYREVPNDLGESQRESLSKDDLQTDEERQQWDDYVAKSSEVERKRNDNVMKYIFTDGFDIDITDMEEWKKQEEEEYGLELPTSPIQLKMEYINARVVGNADDLGEIMAGVLERTGVPAETLDEVRNSFRGAVRQGSTPEITPEPIA